MGSFSLIVIALSSFFHVIQAGLQCSTATLTRQEVVRDADFLFLIDASGSMCPYVQGLKDGLAYFARRINQSDITGARFAFVQFGGTPVIRLPFTTDIRSLQTILDTLSCNAGGQEASFEAIRRALPPLNGTDFRYSCPTNMGGTTKACKLNWRPSATKVIILATDEDSDLPVDPKYRMPGQTQAGSFCQNLYQSNGACLHSYRWEPSFTPARLYNYASSNWNMFRNGTNMQLGNGYQAEIDHTARMLKSQGVIVQSLISLKPGAEDWVGSLPVSAFDSRNRLWNVMKRSSPSLASDNQTVVTRQFGDPLLQVQSVNYSLFNAEATLSRLENGGLGNSLQAQILRDGYMMRLFDIKNFQKASNTPLSTAQMQIVNSFYDQMVSTVEYQQENCKFIPDSTVDAIVTKTTSTSTSSVAVTSSSVTSASSSGTTATSTDVSVISSSISSSDASTSSTDAVVISSSTSSSSSDTVSGISAVETTTATSSTAAVSSSPTPVISDSSSSSSSSDSGSQQTQTSSEVQTSTSSSDSTQSPVTADSQSAQTTATPTSAVQTDSITTSDDVATTTTSADESIPGSSPTASGVTPTGTTTPGGSKVGSGSDEEEEVAIAAGELPEDEFLQIQNPAVQISSVLIIEATPSNDATDNSESSTNGRSSNVTTTAAAVGSVSGLVAIGASAVGLLMYRRRLRGTQKFQSITGTTDMQGSNPLYAETRYQENPLFEPASSMPTSPIGQVLAQGSSDVLSPV